MRLLIIPAALIMAGCLNSNRQENVQLTRTTERVGIEQGQQTQISETVVERSTTDEKTQSGIDVGKIVAMAVAAAKGDIISAIQEMRPTEPKSSGGIDGATGGLAAGAASLGLIALREYFAKRAASRDAEEGWQKAQEAHAREVDLARQLPPKDKV